METSIYKISTLLQEPLPQALAELRVNTMGGGGPVDLDLTYVIYLVIFLITWGVLKGKLFDPYLKLKEARESATVGARTEASKMKHEADAILGDYDAKLKAARQDAEAKRQELRAKGEASRKETLEAAYAQSGETLADHRAKLQAQVATAREDLRAEAKALSTLIADQLIPEG